MNVNCIKNPASDEVQVEGELTIYTAEVFRDTLFPCIDQSPSITLNLDRVVEFDSAGLQILLVAHNKSHALGKIFVITDCSKAVTEVFTLYQLDPKDLHALNEEAV